MPLESVLQRCWYLYKGEPCAPRFNGEEQEVQYQVSSIKDRPEKFKEQDKISCEGWPPFMLNDPVANQNWITFMSYYADHQLMIMSDNEILSIVNTIPLSFDDRIENLPEGGWDWGILKGVRDIENKSTPDTLMGIQVVVSNHHKGKGLSSISTDEMLKLAKSMGYGRLIIPLRPYLKDKYPLTPMADYVTWTADDKLPFDPWLRTHVRKGARIVKVCEESMKIWGTSEEWKSWTGMEFHSSGQYVVPGALAPVKYDARKDYCEYIEPNVWIAYETS